MSSKTHRLPTSFTPKAAIDPECLDQLIVHKKSKALVPKLFCICWLHERTHDDHIRNWQYDYYVARTNTGALIKFRQEHGSNSYVIKTTHVSSKWTVRWPIMWARIGKAAVKTHRRNMERYKKWIESWSKVWADITENYEKAYRKRYEDWISMWRDIGSYRSTHLSRWELLEVD